MKNFVSFTLCICVLSFLACRKNEEPIAASPSDESRANYDTTAIDSFSSGAISVDVARQIRISSKQYQDSLREAIRLQEEEKKINEALAKEEEKKKDEEKKKAEKEKKEAENTPQ